MVVRVVHVMRFAWVAGIALVLLALLALVVLGVGLTKVLVTAQTYRGSSSSQPSAQMIGSSARLGLMQATVTTVRILPVDIAHRPAANHEFVAVSIRLANVGQTAVSYRASDFTLRIQPDGMVNPDVGGSALIGLAALPNQGTLQPTSSIIGDIVFEVPMSDHAATLIWQPTVATGDGAVAWRLVL